MCKSAVNSRRVTIAVALVSSQLTTTQEIRHCTTARTETEEQSQIMDVRRRREKEEKSR